MSRGRDLSLVSLRACCAGGARTTGNTWRRAPTRVPCSRFGGGRLRRCLRAALRCGACASGHLRSRTTQSVDGGGRTRLSPDGTCAHVVWSGALIHAYGAGGHSLQTFPAARPLQSGHAPATLRREPLATSYLLSDGGRFNFAPAAEPRRATHLCAARHRVCAGLRLRARHLRGWHAGTLPAALPIHLPRTRARA